MAKVTANVYVYVDGYAVLLQPGDEVPDGVEITNPDALEESADEKPAEAPKKAPAKAPAKATASE